MTQPYASDFAVYAWRFHFVAQAEIAFPQRKAANTIRGAFGLAIRKLSCRGDCPGAAHCPVRRTCPYARIFEPRASAGSGPSGLADWPRPFVLRAVHLDGTAVRTGDGFHFDLHVFMRAEPEFGTFREAFREVGRQGIGPQQGAAHLDSVSWLNSDSEPTPKREPILTPIRELQPLPVHRVRLTFLTPTELKGNEGLCHLPDFSTVFARARDRVATLSTLYGAGPLALDFKGLGERSNFIRMKHHDIRTIEAERRSSRTGQLHQIGGFVGVAEYEGEVTEFLPILRAARWTGIGRQTVWGKGDIRCTPLG